MKIKKKGDEPAFEVPPSMIDITFLLLIFFICSARFRPQEGNLETHLPKDKGLMNQPHKIKPEEVEDIRIRIIREGVAVNTYLNKALCMNADELYQKLSGLHTSFPDKPVVIDGDKSVPFQHVVNAINACLRAKITNFNFAAPKDVAVGG